MKALDYVTIPLQVRGDDAYVQVTIKTTHTDANQFAPAMTVRDLKGVQVSGWFRRGEEDSSSGASEAASGSSWVTETNSYALPLHPAVISIVTAQFAGQMRTADAAHRAKLGHCLHLLKAKGPSVSSFSHLGSECLDAFPQSAPPPR